MPHRARSHAWHRVIVRWAAIERTQSSTARAATVCDASCLALRRRRRSPSNPTWMTTSRGAPSWALSAPTRTVLLRRRQPARYSAATFTDVQHAMALTPAISAWTPSPLQGRVVVITGGAQGIGRGIAQAVLGAGGSVMIGDLDADAGRACLQEWALPRHSAFVRCDAAREAQAARLITTALKRFGRIDGLVNNAGVPDPHSAALSQLDWDEWNRRLSSLHGAFLCSKHALPALTQAPGGGAIVNIASTRAWQSAPHSEAYAAAKGGLVALTHALALSEGPQVRVNSISLAGSAPMRGARRNVGVRPSCRVAIMRSIRPDAWGRPKTSHSWRSICLRRSCPVSLPGRMSSSTAVCRARCSTCECKLDCRCTRDDGLWLMTRVARCCSTSVTKARSQRGCTDAQHHQPHQPTSMLPASAAHRLARGGCDGRAHARRHRVRAGPESG